MNIYLKIKVFFCFFYKYSKSELNSLLYEATQRIKFIFLLSAKITSLRAFFLTNDFFFLYFIVVEIFDLISQPFNNKIFFLVEYYSVLNMYCI